MHIHDVELFNWCQYRHLYLEFGPGLTAIRGPNGVGKTNAMNAVVFAVTGEFNRNPGVKVDNINKLAGSNERSGVIATLSHGDVKTKIQRNLRPGSQRLHIEGERPDQDARSVADINARMSAILSANNRLLLDYVFVAQRQIFAFIDQDPGERAKAFSQLFSAERADHIWKVMGEYQVKIPELSIDGDKVRIRVAQNTEEISKVREELGSDDILALRDDWTETMDPAYQLLQDHRRMLDLQSEAAKHEQTANEWRTKLVMYASEEASLTGFVNQLTAAVDEAKPQANEAVAAISNWHHYEISRRTLQSLYTQREFLTRQQTALVLPEKPEGYVEAKTWPAFRAELTRRNVRISTLQGWLNPFDKGKMRECPTCGTSIEDLNRDFDEYRAEVEALQPGVDRDEVSLAASIAYNGAFDRYHHQLTSLNDRAEALTPQIAELKKIQAPSGDKQTLQELWASFSAVEEELNKQSKARTAVTTRLTDARARLQMAEGQMAANLKDRQLFNVSVEEATAAKQHLQTTRAKVNRKNELVSKLAVLERAVSDDTTSLERLEEEKRQSANLRVHAAQLDEAREVFKQLPRLRSQACLESMHRQINEMLERFEAPFRVQSIKDLKFTIKKHNGVVIPADRLSVGESIVFALAFRIVVNSKFAETLGALWFDEPTAGLDTDNLKCIEVALGRLREFSKTCGLQVVMITHDRELDPLFDRVIELSAAA